MKRAPRRSPTPRSADPEDFHRELDRTKRESTLELLLRVARRTDEEALRLLTTLPGQRPWRRSHTSLLPHIDLEGTRITVLAERLGISKQAVSQLVDELEAFGAVERTPDPRDGRARLVRFTQSGRRGLLEGLALLTELERRFIRRIGARRMQELKRSLLLLDDALSVSSLLRDTRGE